MSGIVYKCWVEWYLDCDWVGVLALGFGGPECGEADMIPSVLCLSRFHGIRHPGILAIADRSWY